MEEINMTEIETIKRERFYDIDVTIEEVLAFNCMGGPCTGNVLVTYRPNEELVEFESFRAFVKSLDEGILESIVEKVWLAVLEAASPKTLDVVGTVLVSASHGPAKVTMRGTVKK